MYDNISEVNCTHQVRVSIFNLIDFLQCSQLEIYALS